MQQKQLFITIMMLAISTLAQAQWTKVATPFSTFPPVDQSLVARGNNVLCISKGNQAYFSTDAGATWKLANLNDPFAFPTLVGMTNKKLIVADANSIYASSDKGATWKVDYSASGAKAFTVLQNVTYAATKKGVIVYNENSAKWEAAGLTNKVINYLYNDGTNLFAFELLANGSDYVTHRSADNGKTWTQPTNIYVPEGIAKSGNTLYACYGSSSGIATSNDKGVTWTQNNLSNLPNSAANAMIAIDDTLYVSFKGGAFTSALGFYRYNAQNNTWIDSNSGLGASETNLVALAYDGNGTLWAIQKGDFNANGALWSYKIGKKTIPTRNLALAENTIQLYPNPAHEGLLLKINPNITLTSVSIINAQGQRQRHFGNPDVLQNLDISSLPAGIYWLQCNSEDGVITKRFVKD